MDTHGTSGSLDIAGSQWKYVDRTTKAVSTPKRACHTSWSGLGDQAVFAGDFYDQLCEYRTKNVYSYSYGASFVVRQRPAKAYVFFFESDRDIFAHVFYLRSNMSPLRTSVWPIVSCFVFCLIFLCSRFFGKIGPPLRPSIFGGNKKKAGQVSGRTWTRVKKITVWPWSDSKKTRKLLDFGVKILEMT